MSNANESSHSDELSVLNSVCIFETNFKYNLHTFFRLAYHLPTSISHSKRYTFLLGSSKRIDGFGERRRRYSLILSRNDFEDFRQIIKWHRRQRLCDMISFKCFDAFVLIVCTLLNHFGWTFVPQVLPRYKNTDYTLYMNQKLIHDEQAW